MRLLDADPTRGGAEPARGGADPRRTDGAGRDRTTTPTGAPARLWLHAALLAVVLGVLAAWSAAGGQAVTDEGSVLAQADLLTRGAWGRPVAFPVADPDGRFPAMENANVAGGREFPYVKHVTYPVVLAALSGPFGGAAASVVSSAGVWLAAVGAALLTRRGVPGRGRPDPAAVALWGTALLTPLVFDAGVAMAVGPAAGLVAMVATGLVVAADPLVPLRRRWAAALTAPVAAALAVLLRSEALLVVGALGASAVVAASVAMTRTRGIRAVGAVRSAGVTAGWLVAASGVLAYVLDGRLTARVLGAGGLAVFTTSARGADPVAARVSAVWSSVLRPGFEDRGTRPLLLVVAAVCVVAAALLVRRRAAPRSVASCAVGAAVAASLAVWWSPGLVTGLVPAAPVLVGGLLLVRRGDLRRPSLGVPLVAAGLAGLAILALSYPEGGGAEWGGRYLHVVVPLVVPASVLGWSRARANAAGADGSDAAPVGGVTLMALVVVAGVLSLGALGTLAQLRDRSATFLSVATPVLRAAPTDSSDGRPVVVTDRTGLGRFAWRELDGVDLVTVPAGSRQDLRVVADRLDSAGRDRWSLVLAAGAPLPWGSDAPWIVTGRERLGSWEMVAVARRPPPQLHEHAFGG